MLEIMNLWRAVYGALGKANYNILLNCGGKACDVLLGVKSVVVVVSCAQGP